MNQLPFIETADIETSSDKYAQRFSGNIGKFFLDVQSNICLDFLKSRSGASILDVGGGHAQIAVPLVHNGFRVTVTGSADICRSRLDQLLPPGGFTYHTCDILHLPFEDKEFDVVMAFRLLPHVDHWQALVAEMCRVARHTVIVDYPDRRSFNILYNILFKTKKAVEVSTRPFKLFNRLQIAREFQKHHFGMPIFKPEFFIPMVVHRMLKAVKISRILEFAGKALGMTYLFGSPVIVKTTRFYV